MRSDGPAPAARSNSGSRRSNGSTLTKAAISNSLNGQDSASSSSHLTTNGRSHTNGSQKSATTSPRPTYYGHDREEVTRILIQSLFDLGYESAAATLSQESGYELESPAVGAFRAAVRKGAWDEAEQILLDSFQATSDGENGTQPGSLTWGKLALAENANKSEMLFCLRQQKFLELLDARDLGGALMVLRQELTPLNHNIARLHALSSLLMCPPESLREQAGWASSIESSRENLLSDLSGFISPSVMIPDHRLAVLLDHVKEGQVRECLYHNTAVAPSLYSDHICDRNDFPLHAEYELNHHSHEVWYVEFSHDGTKLATASRDHSVIIYDTYDFSVINRLLDHDEPVAYAKWSPDDTKLITCSQDKKARVWEVATGRCLLTITQHLEPVTAAAWAPDGESFVTASLDVKAQLCHWSMHGHPIYLWPGGFRVQDCAVTPDGQKLIAADEMSKLHVYNFVTHREEYSLPLKSKCTSISTSRDSKYMLLSLAEGQVLLVDIETSETIRRYHGQKQGEFVIRSGFGGAAENFIVSGSEDSCIYIWKKENGTLIETVEGHISGCVNAVSWNPKHPSMFASAGDDFIVRIWTKGTPHAATPGNRVSASSSSNSARISALRSTTNL